MTPLQHAMVGHEIVSHTNFQFQHPVFSTSGLQSPLKIGIEEAFPPAQKTTTSGCSLLLPGCRFFPQTEGNLGCFMPVVISYSLYEFHFHKDKSRLSPQRRVNIAFFISSDP